MILTDFYDAYKGNPESFVRSPFPKVLSNYRHFRHLQFDDQ